MKNIAFMPVTLSDKNSVKLWKTLPEDIVGKRKMKEIKKKRKETMRFAGLMLHQFQGMSNPDSVQK